jgi:hypothetical protein
MPACVFKLLWDTIEAGQVQVADTLRFEVGQFHEALCRA